MAEMNTGNGKHTDRATVFTQVWGELSLLWSPEEKFRQTETHGLAGQCKMSSQAGLGRGQRFKCTRGTQNQLNKEGWEGSRKSHRGDVCTVSWEFP
jgi:hypothetical protein